ncbi:manganese/iron transport system permease protein [Streptomyces sp. 2112.3]|uniref:metal ABC transporter permease n=1 Tax=unclassified Streptomyces TaxID=2593676 RepID=UPI0008978490|nr:MULTISPECIES: metal ABC transporter permease [unclassified Streptomyces]MCW7987433.1 manganese transporter [Streptomyces platensis subsp. clarensis]SED85804.1 manganese/iron transport system permease protein [Streptomyces sp. 2112.3]
MRILIDPFYAPYMARALAELVILGVLGGAVGVFVLVRRLAYVADALTHTVFPGVVIGFAAGAADGVFWGALAAGLLTATLLTLLTRAPRISEDAALTILLTALFGLGVVLVSQQRSYHHDLTAFLFGQVLTVTDEEIVQSTTLALACLTVLATLSRPLTLRAFDPEGARALGYRIGLLDLALNTVIALVVVAAVRSVGTVLVIALMVIPAATGRLVSHRIPVIAVTGAAFGGLCGWLGLAASNEASLQYGLPLAAGPAVVLLMVTGYLALRAATALTHRTATKVRT